MYAKIALFSEEEERAGTPSIYATPIVAAEQCQLRRRHWRQQEHQKLNGCTDLLKRHPPRLSTAPTYRLDWSKCEILALVLCFGWTKHCFDR